MNDIDRIKNVLDFTWNNKYSSFYKDKYTKAGIKLKISSMDDFKSLPHLEKKELAETSPFDRFFLPFSEFKNFAVSSGTSGGTAGISIVFRGNPSGEFKKRLLKHQYDSIMYLLPPVQASGALLRLSELSSDKSIRVLADLTNLALSAKLASNLSIDSLVGGPTAIYFFLPYLKKEYDLDKIKYVVLVGEFCSKEKAIIIKKSFKNAKIYSGYALSESQSRIGESCEYLNSLETHYFHPSADFYLETLNGELIVTSLTNNSFPLIRYKTGDLVEINDYKCECGKTKIMKILGKTGISAARVHGVFIYASLIDKAISLVSHLLGRKGWNLVVKEESVSGKIMPKLKLALLAQKDKKTGLIKDQLEKKISENLLITSNVTLNDLVNKGVFLPLEVELLDSLKQDRVIFFAD